MSAGLSFSKGLGRIQYTQAMNNSNIKLRTFRIGLPLALVFAATLLIGDTSHAHEVIGADGKPTHSHVYKKAPYGNGVIAGHAANPPGSNGIVIWQSAPEQGYNRAQSGMSVPRDPWSKKNHKSDQKQMYKQKPAFKKGQSHTPDLNPE